MCIRDRLSSVFRNLADNAAAYSGGRDIFIRLLSDTAEACTILDVYKRQTCGG